MHSVPDKAYRRYSSIEDVVEQYGEKKLIGREVSKPHFMSIEGVRGSHHSLIEFVGPYTYQNVICVTMGASKTYFVERNGRMEKVNGGLRPIKIPNDRSPDFIILVKGRKNYLYHIPSGTSSNESIGSRCTLKMINRGLFDVRGSDKQIEWTGGQFIIHDNEKVDEPDSDVQEVELNGEEWSTQEMDMREAYRYNDLLDGIIRRVNYIRDREEAKMFLNGKIELGKDERFMRKYNSIRQAFFDGMLDINRFEKELNALLEDYENIIDLESLEEQRETEDIIGETEDVDDENEKESLLEWD